MNLIVRLSFISLMLAISMAAKGQVPPSGTNSRPPDAYFQRLGSDPNAFSFGQSFLGLAQKVHDNRSLIMNAASPEFAMAAASMQGGVTVGGTKLIPVATALYSDMPSPPYDKKVLAAEFFDAPPPSRTISDFYSLMSYGNLNVKGVVLDWQQLVHPAAWYAGDDYKDVKQVMHHCQGLCSGTRVAQLITELLDQNRNVDWGQFDNDGPDRKPNSGDDDGFVDFIVIVHPGIGGECNVPGNTAIWSHRGQLQSKTGAYATGTASATPGLGNIKINDYVIVPALACDGVSPNPIGIVAHEFGHAFGLPDLYDIFYKTNGGVGDWDLMATGAWGGDDNSPSSPTQMSAWAKEYLGWVTPLPVTGDIGHIALVPIAVKAMAYRVPALGSKYFLISNRQQTGYDSLLPKPGLLIEAIDQTKLEQGWKTNQVNTDPTALGVQVIEADGATGLTDPLLSGTAHRQSSGDVFPVPPVVNLDANSNPSSPGPFALCGIHQIGTDMHAQLLVGSTTCPASSSLAAPTPPVVPQQPTAKANNAAPAVSTPNTSVDALLHNPQSFVGKSISLSGVIQNTGTNYFTNLNLTLTDPTGRSVPVTVVAPTELPPSALNDSTPTHPATISNYLGKSVTATGTIVEREVQGQGRFLS